MPARGDKLHRPDLPTRPPDGVHDCADLREDTHGGAAPRRPPQPAARIPLLRASLENVPPAHNSGAGCAPRREPRCYRVDSLESAPDGGPGRAAGRPAGLRGVQARREGWDGRGTAGGGRHGGGVGELCRGAPGRTSSATELIGVPSSTPTFSLSIAYYNSLSLSLFHFRNYVYWYIYLLYVYPCGAGQV